jgi:hypothetical protein
MKKIPVPKFTVKTLPFFGDGVLRFQESGHKLTLSDRNYRCALDCNGKCGLGEKQINAKKLERNFYNFTKKFTMDEVATKHVRRQYFKEAMSEIFEKVLTEDERQDEMIDVTFEAVIADIKKKRKIQKSDEQDIKRAMIEQQKNLLSITILGFIGESIRAVSRPEFDKGRFLASMMKHIHLSKSGAIIEIEMTKFGWYVLNYFDKNNVGYMGELRSRGIKFRNTSDRVMRLPIVEAIDYFKNNPKDVICGLHENELSKMFAFLRGVLKLLMEDDPKKVQVGMLSALDVIKNNDLFQAMTPAMSILKIKYPKGL